MATAASTGLRLPNLAIMYLVAHYTWTEHSVSSASINYMTNTWVLRATLTYNPRVLDVVYMRPRSLL